MLHLSFCIERTDSLVKPLNVSILCFWLLFALQALASDGDPPSEPDPQVADVLLVLRQIESRLDQFDERLARLESDQTSTQAVNVDDRRTDADLTTAETSRSSLESTIRQLRSQVAGLERRLASAPVPAQPTVLLAADRSDPVEESELEVPSPDNLLFHPSRDYVGDLHYGVAGGKIDLHAFIDLEYIDSGPDGSRGGVSTFDNHHANVFLRSWLRPNLLAYLEVEYEHSGDVVEIDQAYASWRINPRFNLDAGRFYTPFGIERFVQFSPANALVSRPGVMRQIIPGNFYANGVKSWGILGASDSSSRWTYDVAISDGLGDEALESRRSSRQTRDNNSNRALTGRLSYTFWPYLEIGSSYHTQRYSTVGDLDIDFFGLDVSGRWRGFDFRAEWVEADVDTAGGGVHEETGWYLQTKYTRHWDRDLFPSIGLVARLDDLDLDRSAVGNNDIESLSLGLNFEIYDHFRFKTEYQWTDESGPERDNDTLYLQFVIDY